MYSAGSLPVERPDGLHSHGNKSATHSPAGSRRSSLSSLASAQTDPGAATNHSRRSSATSTTSANSSKSGLRSLFGRKDKKPKEKKDFEKIVLTSKHAAAVKTKMQMDPKYKHKKTKTAEVVGNTKTAHLTAAEQEARHPHSGPPARHILKDMPLLTRIVSGDERDEEEETVIFRRQSEWDMAKKPSVARIREHDSPLTSADNSGEEDDEPVPRAASLSPGIERALNGEERRSSVVARNSYGTRFRRDESGKWTRGRS